MKGPTNKAVRIASSHIITTCATIAALLMFVVLGSQVLSPAFAHAHLPENADTLKVAFLLNIAIVLFGWRRSKDLGEALAAYEEAEKLARRNANTDPTTGLSNRRELMRSLEDTIEAKKSGVVLLLDLDHFKRVNDLHGHLAGDHLLRFVGEVLVKSAPAGSCCARIGGDEFAVMLEGIGSAEAERVANAILRGFAKPVPVDKSEVRVSVSIGLAAMAGAMREEDVLRQSDVALYAAKRAGRDCFAWFDRELERELSERLKLEEDIRFGIQNKEFVPFFQPLIDLETRELVGFETLARWRSPTRGFVEAEAFIETAESTGLIGPLTMMIMEQALTEARSWPQHLKLAVNVSPVQFRDKTLAEQITKVLTRTGFAAHRLEIEVTEGSLLEDRDQVRTIMQSLKNLGISISLDDFGTGYASFAQVNTLPIDRIKIDKSFISTIVKSEQTAAIVNSIASLGHTLKVPITAEGVESEQIRNELKKFGCSEAQGWLFGRAVSADTVRTFLGMREPDDAADPLPDPEDAVRFTPRLRRR
ncbi:putative bifunctional diguanylate cyclase/phosphodiesterase [Sphingomonas hankyongi]|uniref:EAL domain-containing protein n=1 Tax=Sphingomonas hankyongi TaxID=2908209 RepID=A0ABT0S274_9SPHN|nr:EAL domain-containing protein [Sphingomonas hankyongi]MCL6729948.1 EAL domain-containing protein [Sphingomonas hankyongi]